MTQQPYASPWAFNMLLSNSGRVSDWGTGASTSNTLRVVQASDSAVNIPDLMITGTAQTTLNNNLLSGSTVATDVSLYRSISFQVVTSGTVSAGAFFPEQSNDGVNWQTVGYYQNNNAIPSITTSAWNMSTGFNQIYHAALTCRYFRLRISTAITGGGTALAVARLSPMSHSTGLFGVFGNINANNTQLTGNLFTDINDTLNTITTSTSSSNALALFGTFTVGVRVTALTGTGTPAMDVRIEESFDNANTWIRLYHFERITATGTFYSPPLRATGTHIRYVRVTTGSTISISTTISRQTKQIASTYIKNLVDRTVAPNTLNSTTPVLMTEGCNKFAMIVSSGAGASVNPVFKLQGSEDNSNWYDISGVTVTATPSTTVVANTGTNEDMPKFIRAIVSTAGTGATLNYAVLKAQGKP